MKVQDLLSRKTRPIPTIAGDHTVGDAIRLMTDQNVSALIVTESQHPVGIFAERDVFRCYVKDKFACLSDIPLKNAITRKLIAAKPEDDVSAVMALMIKADIKHIPVMENNKIIAMLTLNDLIENQIETLTAELHHLREYIADLHDAGQD
jgi:IMP dehydrogenase